MDSNADIIRQKAEFITALRETGVNEKESLRRARLHKIEALEMAANDTAFRAAWEKILNRKVF